MKHLNSALIDSLESRSLEARFNDRFGELCQVIRESNSYVGKYHNTDHLIGTGYIIYLMLKYKGRTDSAYFDSIVIAGLFHDYCYLGEKDDRINIEHSKAMLRLLAFERPDLFNKDYLPLIEELIDFTHYDFDNPTPEVPRNASQRIHFSIMRDADQIYASLFFSKEMFEQLYEDIGKRFNYTREEFVIRNKNYVAKISEQIHDDFGRIVLREIADELAEAHDKLL